MRRCAWLLLAVMLIAGCIGGRAVDPAPVSGPVDPASAVGPRLVERTVHREVASPKHPLESATVLKLLPGEHEAVVGLEGALITWRFDRSVEGWEERVRTEGATPITVRAVGPSLQIRFDDRAPASWRAWIEGVDGSQVNIRRSPQPTVRIRYRQEDGPLVDLVGEELRVPEAPLTLELRFDQPIAPDSLELVRKANPAAQFEANWLASDHLEMHFAGMPTLLRLRLEAFCAAATGLPLTLRPLTLTRSETAPYLERYNLVTGESKRVGAVPVDLVEARLSPNKRWVALRSWVRTGDTLSEMNSDRVTLLDLQTGHVQVARMNVNKLGWLADATLFSVDRYDRNGWITWNFLQGEQPIVHRSAHEFSAFSPTGRLAGLKVTGDWLEVTSNRNKPYWRSLILFDPLSGEEVVVDSFSRSWYLGAHVPENRGMAWSPDGTRIAALDQGEQERPDLVIYDLRTGKREVVQRRLNISPWEAELLWHPTREAILIRNYLVSLDGSPVIDLGRSQRSPLVWDDQGERILSATGEWQGLSVHDLASGKRTELGDGWPVGWDGDWVYLIRWAASDQRYIYVSPF